MNRRDFLRTTGITGIAGTAACVYDPQTPVEHAYPYVAPTEDTLPGSATYFSTGCTECAAGCGMVARAKEGRVVMVEGNPDHPMSQGLCTRGHMTLLGTYAPDRVTTPMDAGKPTSWDDALKKLTDAITAAKAAGKEVAWLGQYRTGSAARLLEGITAGIGLRRVHWEALGVESLLAAARATFGVSALPAYELSEARTILSFGMDFLGTAYGMMGMTKGWAMAKDPAHGGFVTRLVAIEPRVGITSAQADHFFPATPGTELHAALGIARLAMELNGYTGPAAALLAGIDPAASATACGISLERLREIATWITGAPSVILPGGFANSGTDGTALAIASLVLNEVCGNVGTRVVFGRELGFGQVNSYADVKSLLDDARAGKIGVLLLDGANPVFNLPGSDKAAEALDAVGLLVQLGNEVDDSTRPATLVLPTGSGLETWGDAAVLAGTHTLQQATMVPLFDTRSVGDILLAVGRAVLPPPPPADPAVPSNPAVPSDLALRASDSPDFKSYVKARWKAEIYRGTEEGFEAFWTRAREKGGHFESVAATGAPFTLASLPVPGAVPTVSGRALVVFPSPNLGDGRFANRPWAQELPDPTTTIAWTTWVELHPKTVASLGLSEGDLVQVETAAGSIKVGFFASKGVREDSAAVVLGNGHVGMGRYARGRGANPMTLLESAADPLSGALVVAGTSVKVTRAGTGADTFELVGNIDQDGRHFANVVAAADAVSHIDGAAGSLIHHSHPQLDRRLTDRGITDMFPEPQHPTYRFAMAIDTNTCTGCNACVIACNLENNIPFVGPDQTRRGRGMSWIRMDRFWEGEGEHQDVRHMPSLCQQCSHAPCEGVCPVLATYHNLDGLNAMIYNRCVGTRYCANNCPYTARRFNFHTWTWPESMHLMLNPDVSVREMGVMEKCTFCVQRIRSVKDSWRDVNPATERQRVPDHALRKLTACATACPTDSITFGDAQQTESAVSRKFANARAYTLLGELNTKPGIRYLAKARHHVKSDHGATTGHGDASGHGAEGVHKAAPAHEDPGGHAPVKAGAAPGAHDATPAHGEH